MTKLFSHHHFVDIVLKSLKILDNRYKCVNELKITWVNFEFMISNSIENDEHCQHKVEDE